jgi:hypothetical protein
MVRRVLPAATHRRERASATSSAPASAPGITSRHPCLDGGSVAPSEADRRRLRSIGAWAAWALFALGAAAALLT